MVEIQIDRLELFSHVFHCLRLAPRFQEAMSLEFIEFLNFTYAQNYPKSDALASGSKEGQSDDTRRVG